MTWMGSGAGGSGAGGSGAGGSGAGGSGAGGSGAGGSGAGGSGAGGSGAGGHAGGPSSPLLSTALAITNDAIVGHWDGSPDEDTPGRPDDLDDLSYLSPERRMSLLESELMGHFSVDKVGDVTSLKVNSNEVCKLEVPDADFFRHQLIWLRNYADLRTDRVPEIHLQQTDLLSFFGISAPLDSGASRYTLELLIVVQRIAYALSMQIKHQAWAPRPIAYSRKVQPIIQTPDHSTFPSGHAVESFAIAEVLNSVLASVGGDAGMPNLVAHRITVNRVIAGVHFPVDNFAGAILGQAIGRSILKLLKTGEIEVSEFVPGQDFDKDDDFLLPKLAGVALAQGATINTAKPIAEIYAKRLFNGGN